MVESYRDDPAQRLHPEPQVLANLLPSTTQLWMARVVMIALLAILAATWPFARVKLPEVGAFVPTLAAALFVSDSVTAALLFGQFAILRRWSLLIIASGYFFSALIVVAHALAFPGAFSPTGLFGAGLQSAVWLYWLWHAGLPLAVIGYTLLKEADRPIDDRRTGVAIRSTITATFVLVMGMFWFVTQYHDLLPVTFVANQPLSLFRRMIGGVVILVLGGVAFWLLWSRRRTLLDEWLMVALLALLIEVALASVLSGDRFTVSWYAGRFYQLITATVLMVVLLVETTTQSAEVFRANVLLERERLLLSRAVQAQRREREARLMTGDAVTTTIAHEVKQPLSAMITRADAGLRFLTRPNPDLDEAKEAFKQISADGHRAGAVIGGIRTLFKRGERKMTPIDLNNLIQESLAVLQQDLAEQRVLVKLDLHEHLPLVVGDPIQLQQVLVNLLTNALDAMADQAGSRVLSVKSDIQDDGDIRVSVADTGTGIGSHEVDQIFNPLFTTKSEGMGMGLAICRSIVESHKGRLWVTSNEPRGAIFHFCCARSVQS